MEMRTDLCALSYGATVQERLIAISLEGAGTPAFSSFVKTSEGRMQLPTVIQRGQELKGNFPIQVEFNACWELPSAKYPGSLCCSDLCSLLYLWNTSKLLLAYKAAGKVSSHDSANQEEEQNNESLCKKVVQQGLKRAI